MDSLSLCLSLQVHKLCDRGVAGACVEDKLFPKTNSLLDGRAQPLADVKEFSLKITVSLSIYVSVCPSVCLTVCLAVCLAVCLLGLFVCHSEEPIYMYYTHIISGYEKYTPEIRSQCSGNRHTYTIT